MAADQSPGLQLGNAILTQIDWWWEAIFRRRLEGLTDDELWWEPARGCWTLHRGADGLFRYEWPPGSRGETVPPFTTIAWRLCHLGLMAMAHWVMAMEGDTDAATKAEQLAFPETAQDAVALVEHWWQRWRSTVGGLDDVDLWRPLSESALAVDAPAMGLGAGDPFVQHLLHQHREFIHHGSEVNLLRDLFRARSGRA